MTKRLPCLAAVLGVYALASCAAASVHPTTFDELADALAGNQDIVLTQSIDAQGATWAGTTDYSAHFNGGGFIISNYSGSQLISRLNGEGVFEYVGFTNLNAYYGVIRDMGERLGPHTARVRKVFAVGQMAGSGSQNRAGIVGLIRAGYIDDCWADYPKTGDWCGGVVGYAQSGYITHCYSISSDVVGYVEAMGGPVISASYYNSDLTDSRGGTPKTTAEMMAQATYAGWDFTNVWGIDAGRNYPQLRNFVPEPATLALVALGGVSVLLRRRRK